MSELSADDVLELIGNRAQWCRENSESDMRNILNFIGLIKKMKAEGRSALEIFAALDVDKE